MPPNTVKVDRTTKWGNPAIVGKDGTAADCVYWYVLLLAGWTICQAGIGDRQVAAGKVLGKESRGWIPNAAREESGVLVQAGDAMPRRRAAGSRQQTEWTQGQARPRQDHGGVRLPDGKREGREDRRSGRR